MFDPLGLSLQLRQAKNAIANSTLGQTGSRQAANRVEEVDAKVRQLTARLRVLEAIVAQAVGLTPEKIGEIVDAEVKNLMAATLSEGATVVTVACPGCGRRVNRQLSKCQTCGAAVP
jgi:hypothetical protein